MQVELKFTGDSLSDVIEQIRSFNTGAAPTAAPKTAKQQPAKQDDPVPQAEQTATTTTTNAGGKTVTLEDVRAVAVKKVNPVSVFKQMGYAGLAAVPAERMAEALELVKALPNK